jgi:hypothetical protein
MLVHKVKDLWPASVKRGKNREEVASLKSKESSLKFIKTRVLIER